jgi:ubiquinone/menaquinone biosynthesis C-methylase UbiE
MTVPDWRLPRGVSRSLWEYTQQPAIATGYDQSISNSPLSRHDTEVLFQHFRSPERLVDLGCGTGRHAVAFAQQGYDVLGVDLSAEMLRQLQQKANLANVTVAGLRANLCELDGLPDGCFDSAILMYATLGMIPAAADRSRVLQQVQRIVKPGGRFALHVHNKWFNLFDSQGRAWLWRDVWRSWWHRQPAGDRIVHDRGIPNFQMHVFSQHEIGKLLHDAGFQIEAWHRLNATASGPLLRPWLAGRWRANGWIIIAKNATVKNATV